MKFNKFLWSFYAGSDRGKSSVYCFSSLSNKHIDQKLREYAFDFYDEFKSQYPSPILAVDIAELIKNFTLSESFKNQRDANRYYERMLVKKGVPVDATDNSGKTEAIGTFGVEEEDWYDYIAAISLGLYGHTRIFSCLTIFARSSTNWKRFTHNSACPCLRPRAKGINWPVASTILP